jgi:hypothetical protein
MDHFGLDAKDRQNQQVLDQIDFVLTYAKNNTESGDLLDALTFLRDIESRLGLGFKGNKLFHLYNWVRLDQEARRIQVEKMNHVA